MTTSAARRGLAVGITMRLILLGFAVVGAACCVILWKTRSPLAPLVFSPTSEADDVSTQDTRAHRRRLQQKPRGQLKHPGSPDDEQADNKPAPYLTLSHRDQPPLSEQALQALLAQKLMALSSGQSGTQETIANSSSNMHHPKPTWELSGVDIYDPDESAKPDQGDQEQETSSAHLNISTWGDPVLGAATSPTSPALLGRLKLPSPPQVEYLGVMVDAAREFFPIRWLKRLVIYLYRLQFNLIQLRLTDDENFVLQLEDPPLLKKLAYSMTSQLYTPAELRDLVKFAKTYNITIVPEINLPSRVAAWAGIPGWIVPCARYICDNGQEVPLNLKHPELKTVLKQVLTQVLDIFDNPPMLHVGGEESDLVDECFGEVGGEAYTPKDYWNQWNAILLSVLGDIGYPPEQVIQLSAQERSVQPQDVDNAARYISHYISSFPAVSLAESAVFVVSKGLEFTARGDALDAVEIFQNTVSLKDWSPKPKAIIASTYFLGPELWRQQNVAARLIAVAMGAASTELKGHRDNNVSVFYDTYATSCSSILAGHSARFCDLHGKPAVSSLVYQQHQRASSERRREATCQRLTDQIKRRKFPSFGFQNVLTRKGNRVFWDDFGRSMTVKRNSTASDTKRTAYVQLRRALLHDTPLDPSKVAKRVQMTGILLDVANSMASPDRIKTILQTYVAPLGINALQLRLVDDHSFVIDLTDQPTLKQSVLTLGSNPVPTSQDYASIVDVAYNLGMEVIPEISISTNSGGWIMGGFLVECPETFCNKGGVANDVRQSEFLAVAYSVLRELREVFSTATYFHLGADERVANEPCLREKGDIGVSPLDSFEQKLSRLLPFLNLSPESVIRWENSERLRYQHRAGEITHYRSSSTVPSIRPNETFLVTNDILAGSLYDVYNRTRALVNLNPLGVVSEVRVLGDALWKTKQIGLRLISYSLGLMSLEEKALSREELSDSVLEVCRKAKFPECSGEAGSTQEAILRQKMKTNGGHVQYISEGTAFRQELCKQHTRIIDARVMKDAFK